MTERVTPSSEEIAAALEVAIRACDVAIMALPFEKSEGYATAKAHLRAHLSRLREEARFRDAARVLWDEFHGADDVGVKRDPYTKAAHAFVSAGVARTLEEPRDG